MLHITKISLATSHRHRTIVTYEHTLAHVLPTRIFLQMLSFAVGCVQVGKRGVPEAGPLRQRPPAGGVPAQGSIL
jgi:hypothetical protein